MRARCSTTKPRSPIGAGFRTCAKNWKKPRELGNVDRAEQAEEEIDALTRELSRAVGLGGRNRRAASASERARQSVTKTIKAVLDRIAENDSALGDILSRCIRTGTFCSYQPDPDFPIAWEFAATLADRPAQPATTGDPVPALSGHAKRAAISCWNFSILARGTDRVCRPGNRSDAPFARPSIARSSGHGSLVMLGGGPGVGKSSAGNGDGGVRVARWLQVLRRALLRKRRAVSLSTVRRDHRK